MKKILTVFLMLILATSAVSAEDSKNTNLTFTVAQEYTWTAPSAITFNALGEDQTGTLTVSKNVIPEGTNLKINIAAGQEFKVTNETAPDTSIAFTMTKGGTALNAGANVLTLAAGTDTGSASIVFKLGTTGATKSGKYIGTVNFVAEVK